MRGFFPRSFDDAQAHDNAITARYGDEVDGMAWSQVQREVSIEADDKNPYVFDPLTYNTRNFVPPRSWSLGGEQS